MGEHTLRFGLKSPLGRRDLHIVKLAYLKYGVLTNVFTCVLAVLLINTSILLADMGVHACNHSMWQAEAGGSQVQGQCGIQLLAMITQLFVRFVPMSALLPIFKSYLHDYILLPMCLIPRESLLVKISNKCQTSYQKNPLAWKLKRKPDRCR